MAYQWIGENWGKSLIEAAVAAGFTVEIYNEETLYQGNDAAAAWEAANWVDDCLVRIETGPAKKEYAVLIFEYGQEGDEVINDFSSDGWIETWWKAKLAATF